MSTDDKTAQVIHTVTSTDLDQQRSGSHLFTDDLMSSFSAKSHSSRRIVLVSATFKLSRSYQENLWAESLADMGYQVIVCVPVDQTHEPCQEVTVTPGGHHYTIVWIPSFLLPRNSALSGALADQIVSSCPELVVWFGAVMFFGRSLYLDERLARIPLITVYSLSRRGRHPFCWYGRVGSWRERAKSLAFQMLRAPVLTRSLRRAQLTIANTPECTDIIRQYVWGEERVRWAHKHTEIPLGFCPYTFSYQPQLRQHARGALSLSIQDVVMLFSTRFAHDKWPALEACFHAVELAISAGVNSCNTVPHMIWVGADQGDVTRRFQALIKTSIYSAQHHLISFQSRERLAIWYHTADITLFPQPSISVQEALGTGVQILCPPDPSLNHLSDYSTCIEYLQLEQWPDRLSELCREMSVHYEEREQERIFAAQTAQSLSYPHLIRRALCELDKRLT